MIEELAKGIMILLPMWYGFYIVFNRLRRMQEEKFLLDIMLIRICQYTNINYGELKLESSKWIKENEGD